MLNAKQLRAAARHARELAMQRLTTGLNGEGTYELLPDPTASGEIHRFFVEAAGVCMLDVPPDLDYAHASVFPLLALADELENAAKGRPQDLP